MNQEDRYALLTLPIVILIGIGLALSGSQANATIFGIPLFALAVAMAFAIQWIAFIPAYLLQSERFFDLIGSLTYISVIVTALVLSSNFDARSILLTILVTLWATRLGTFLFRRIHKARKDERFDQIKTSFFRFLNAWTLQGLWVTFTLAAALAAVTANTQQELGVFAVMGLVIWLFGFAFEIIADRQKSHFRASPKNKNRFIQTGLWSRSRHPNYFGEIVLWIGVAVISFPALQGWQWVTLISPVFVAVLLTRISGIPLLEKRADAKWGDQKDYQTYKAQTPALIPHF